MSDGPLCPDCAVSPGETHHEDCDIAVCVITGGQRFMDGHADCGEDVWTGRIRGLAECEEFGLYAHLVPGHGWIPCTKDFPGAHPDLNTLIGDPRYQWDRAQLRWVDTGKDQT